MIEASKCDFFLSSFLLFNVPKDEKKIMHPSLSFFLSFFFHSSLSIPSHFLKRFKWKYQQNEMKENESAIEGKKRREEEDWISFPSQYNELNLFLPSSSPYRSLSFSLIILPSLKEALFPLLSSPTMNVMEGKVLPLMRRNVSFCAHSLTWFSYHSLCFFFLSFHPHLDLYFNSHPLCINVLSFSVSSLYRGRK